MTLPEPQSTPKKKASARVLRHLMCDFVAWLFPGIAIPSSTADRRRRASEIHSPIRSKVKAAKDSLRTVVVRYAVTAVVIAVLSYATAATLSLTGTSYTQDFDSVGTALPGGWDVRTGATNTGLGATAAFTTSASTATWGNSAGQFGNFASADGLTSTATTTQQGASTDRVIGVRQTGSLGDPGAAISFNFDATNAIFSGTGTALAFNLQMLSVQTRSTTWTIQYGIGSSPSAWTTLGTWSDPGAFGGTAEAFTGDQLAALTGVSNAWIRVVALGASTGSGSRDTMGIDDFSLAYTAPVVVPPSGLFWIGSDNVLGGNGTWDQNTTPGWSADSTTILARNWNNIDQTANFGGAQPTSTVTVSGTVTAGNGMTFTTDGYTLTGGTINLAGATAAVNTISVSPGAATTTIASALTGTNGFTKAGPGQLLLTGDNSGVTGGITLSAGTLAIGSSTALGAAGVNALALNGGTITSSNATAYNLGNAISFGGDVGLGAPSTGNLELSGTIDFGAGTRTLTVGSGVAVKVSGTTSNGGFLKDGAGSIEFSTSNSLAGFGVNAGTATIDGGVTITTTATGPTFAGGTTTITGTLLNAALGGPGTWGTPSAGATVTVASTGVIIAQGDVTGASGAGSPTNFVFSSGVTWAAGSTLIFRDYNSSPAVANRNYTMNVVFDNSGAGIDVGAISGTSPVTFGKDFTVTEGTHFQYGTYTGVTTFSGNLTIDGVLGYNGGARSITVLAGKNLSVGVNGAVNTQGTQTLTIKGTATVSGDLGGGGSVAVNSGGALTLATGGIIDADSGTTVGGTGTGTFKGAGTVTALTVAGGGTIAPGVAGAGPGTLFVVPSGSLLGGALTLLGGGFYQFELKSDGTGTGGTDWDQIGIFGGTLDISSLTSANPFTLQLSTLTAGNSAGLLGAWDPNTDHTWLGIITSDTGITGTFDSSDFAVDKTGFANSAPGTFSVVQDGNNLDLHYSSTPTPEPTAALSLLTGTAMLLGFRRRRVA